MLGLLAGQADHKSIALWCAREAVIWRALGLRRSPSTSTLWRLTRQVRVAEVRDALGTWVLTLRTARHAAPAEPDPAEPDPAAAVAAGKDAVVALDGKTLPSSPT